MNIDERLIFLIERQTQPSRRFKELEELTKISANRWQSVWHKRQRPMPDMLEIAAQIWPEHAFWLITGITDVEHGHVAPSGVVPTLEPMEKSTNATRDYFNVQIQCKRKVDGNSFWGSDAYLHADPHEKLRFYNFLSGTNRLSDGLLDKVKEIRTRRKAELQAVSQAIEREILLPVRTQVNRLLEALGLLELWGIQKDDDHSAK